MSVEKRTDHESQLRTDDSLDRLPGLSSEAPRSQCKFTNLHNKTDSRESATRALTDTYEGLPYGSLPDRDSSHLRTPPEIS
ncbi:predicted protein [Pyrenophora tritici-repentis Pt-1C-BFP]|uniref:Uncharacterized protein n=1 Tax=Pyrenophora tritici-repentis (strain Pt-1C-BFP) TaxID=426418 RepID=B2VVF3_PYRTR|nr:uncharacterized protein PTRG_02268 [Pyrenophora tritici-repentis Pt-1C-BFP]EDU41706.1 predicted protein [Pyrenophora tritici-repentis Pt-1C-BFP]